MTRVDEKLLEGKKAKCVRGSAAPAPREEEVDRPDCGDNEVAHRSLHPFLKVPILIVNPLILDVPGSQGLESQV
jgi:hypothetical protein